MSGSATTPNYGFTLPAIGGDQNVWGNELNGNWSSLDTILHNLTVAAGGSSASSLPLTGGTLTGPLHVNSSLTVSGTTTLGSQTTINAPLSVNGPTFTSTLGVLGVTEFATSGVNDFLVQRTQPLRIWQWAGGVTDAYHETQGTRYWNHVAFSGPTGNVLMSLESDANLTVWGNGLKPGGGTWAATSDERVKRNVAPYTAGLDAICRLAPISYQYTGAGDTLDDGETYYGLSAQAARPVMPELVFEMDHPRGPFPRNPRMLPGQLGTNLGPLIVALCNAVRELRDRIEARGAT